MQDLRPADLIDFCMVMKYGGINAASRATDRPKSSLSLAIRRLEENLSLRLVDRSKYRFELTEVGQNFYAEIQPLVAELSRITDDYRHHSGQIVGSLRIAAPYEFGAHHLAPLLRTLVAENPQLSVTLDVSNSPPKFLFSQGYDVVFVMTNGSLTDSDVVSCRVFMLERGLFATPKLLARYPKLKKPQDLLKLPLITSPQDLHWRFTDQQHRSMNITIPNSNFKSSNAEARRAAALSGFGVTRIVASFCRPYVRNGQLIRVLPDFNCAPLTVYGVVQERRLMPAPVKKLFEALEAVAPDIFIEKKATAQGSGQINI